MDNQIRHRHLFAPVATQSVAIGRYFRMGRPVRLNELPFHDFNARFVPTKIGGHYELQTQQWLYDDYASSLALAAAIGGAHPLVRDHLPVASKLDEQWQIVSTKTTTHHQKTVITHSVPAAGNVPLERHWYVPVIARHLTLSAEASGLVRFMAQWLAVAAYGTSALPVGQLRRLSATKPRCALWKGPDFSYGLFANETDLEPLVDEDMPLLDWQINLQFEEAKIIERAHGDALSGLYRGNPIVRARLHILGIVGDEDTFLNAQSALRLMIHLPFAQTGYIICELTHLSLLHYRTITNPQTGLVETIMTLQGEGFETGLSFFKAEKIARHTAGNADG